MATLDEFAKTFPTEKVLQQALAKLMSKIPNHSGVQILQGSSELGKDIIFYTPAAFGEKDLNACVVKNTKITGDASSTAGARTVFNQAQQAFDTPLPDENGREQRVKRVFIITPHQIPPATVASISGALRANNNQVQFISGATLVELFKVHWPEYLAEEFKLIQTYADKLTQTTAVPKELEGLSFQYALGPIDTTIKRVYVQPRFHKFIHSYTLDSLHEIPDRFLERVYTQHAIDELTKALKKASEFVGIITAWGMCEQKKGAKARAALGQLADRVGQSWSLALRKRAASATGSVVHSDSFASKLPNVPELNLLLNEAANELRVAVQYLEQRIEWARAHVENKCAIALGQFVADEENSLNRLEEIARLVGSGRLREEAERVTTFTSTITDVYHGPLFVVAPAGFGKTSFCRWHALNDLEIFLQDRSGILPIYIPLHQLGPIEAKTFKDAFLTHAGVSALLPNDGRVPYNGTRVYLDGLDEVPSPAAQRRIADLAREGTSADPTLQIIITARDYVYGPWMTWLPRINLSGFDDAQVNELVGKWLDNDTRAIDSFFQQLNASRPLKEMMITPLLATLIVLVFKQTTGRLPENKTRLYEIFVDLHNGGWDLAKGIQRPSFFSATQKMFVLKRIAARIHQSKRREMLEEQVAQLAEDTLSKVDWHRLRDELLRDGLLINIGSMISFSHHSFQEFLTARHLIGELDGRRLNGYCEDYLRGSDWWQEVLCFYTDLVGKPQELHRWLDERVESVCKSPGDRRSAVEERAEVIKKHLKSSFPFARS